MSQPASAVPVRPVARSAAAGQGTAIVAATVANAAIAAVVLWIQGAQSDGVETALRVTARVSFVYFLMAFVATPLHILAPGRASAWLLRHRRTLGVIFGISMSMHVALILRMFVLYAPERPPMVTWADFYIGIPGLVFVGLMTATSFELFRRTIGPVHWARLHRTGLLVVWAIFFLCLVDSVGRKETPHPVLEYGVFIAALVAAMTLRIAAARRFARAQQGC